MRRSLPLIAIAIALIGCSESGGILPAGPNAYTVSERYAPIRGGSTEAQRVALAEANTYCQQGRGFVPSSMNELSGVSDPSTG
jgi:hypothetical protein